jgi:hypothetical protein
MTAAIQRIGILEVMLGVVLSCTISSLFFSTHEFLEQAEVK